MTHRIELIRKLRATGGPLQAEAAQALEEECAAAARYCKELADTRVLLDFVKQERDDALKQVEQLPA